MPLNDERYTIILNASCSKSKIPEELGPLFEYLKTGEISTEDNFIRRIDERVRAFQEDEEIRRMMSVEDEMRLIYENRLKRQLKEGIEQGIEQGEISKATEIARTMKAKGYSKEEISEIVGISAGEIDRL